MIDSQDQCIVTTVFGCYIILRTSYISSDLPLDNVPAMTMYILVGHYVQPSSWHYSPETEAIGWAHGSLGPTAECRQLLWIVHWFVLFLSDRRTDVSVVGCRPGWLSVLSDYGDPYLLHKTSAVDLRTHCRLCSPTANGSICPTGALGFE